MKQFIFFIIIAMVVSAGALIYQMWCMDSAKPVIELRHSQWNEWEIVGAY